jgi:glc operon protein GlcG
MRTRFALGLSEIELAVQAGCRVALEKGWAVSIAVVDDSGFLLHLSRMDEASPASVAGATEKARTAALTGIETKALEAAVKERPGMMTMGRVFVEGGVPILHRQQRLGGIGVSGVQSDHDAEVAALTLHALLTQIAEI